MNYPAASGRGIEIVLRPKGRGIKPELRNKIVFMSLFLPLIPEKNVHDTLSVCLEFYRWFQRFIGVELKMITGLGRYMCH